MANRGHADVDQVIGRQLRQHFAIDIAGDSVPMDDVEPRTAEYYRGKAAEIRLFARCANSPEVARELFDLAYRFDCMATYAERGRLCPAPEKVPLGDPMRYHFLPSRARTRAGGKKS